MEGVFVMERELDLHAAGILNNTRPSFLIVWWVAQVTRMR